MKRYFFQKLRKVQYKNYLCLWNGGPYPARKSGGQSVSGPRLLFSPTPRNRFGSEAFFRLTFPLLPTTATTTIDTGQRIFRESAVPPERTPSENHRPIGLEQSRTGQMNAGFTLQTNVYWNVLRDFRLHTQFNRTRSPLHIGLQRRLFYELFITFAVYMNIMQ